jgi:hypothetical protein
MDSVSRAAVALAWRIRFATAIMPVIIFSAIVMHYSIATVGTMVLLAGGILASGVAVASIMRARAAHRAWLLVSAAGIAAWAALDAILFWSVWRHITDTADHRLSSALISVLMWILPALGVLGAVAFGAVAANAASTKPSRSFRLLVLLTSAGWLILHHHFFVDSEIGLVGIEEYAHHGLWVAGVVVIPIGLVFVTLSITLSWCAQRVVRWTRSPTQDQLPTAIARQRPVS